MKKFNSQICTSHSQSERLLALGLKKETADCVHRFLNRWDGYCIEENDWSERMYSIEHIPAWSMHRLIEMYLNSTDTRFEIRFNQEGSKKAYEYLVAAIEWLIKEGYFNKEYLCEK